MSREDLHVVLVYPEIHWNTGNIGRSSLAASAQLHLIEPLGFSLDDRQVRRAGLDYWARVHPKVWSAWDVFEAELPNLGSPVFFSADSKNEFWDVDYRGPSTLIYGSESSGLPQEIRERYADRFVRLPMQDPELRSLNLSTSVAVVLFEALRQRR